MQQKHEFYEVAAYCMANGESCPMSDTQYQDFSDRSDHAGQRLAGA
jgi:hypothetical protein